MPTSPHHRPLGSAPSGSLKPSPAPACWLAEPGALSAFSPVSQGRCGPGHPKQWSHFVSFRTPTLSFHYRGSVWKKSPGHPSPSLQRPGHAPAFAERADGLEKRGGQTAEWISGLLRHPEKRSCGIFVGSFQKISREKKDLDEPTPETYTPFPNAPMSRMDTHEVTVAGLSGEHASSTLSASPVNKSNGGEKEADEKLRTGRRFGDPQPDFLLGVTSRASKATAFVPSIRELEDPAWLAPCPVPCTAFPGAPSRAWGKRPGPAQRPPHTCG